MIALFESVGWNTLAALGLAAAVLLAGRIWKRPELLHVLWVVVLVKLVTPGFITIDAIPSPAEPPVAMTMPIALPDSFVAEPVAAPSLSWTAIAFGAWVAGSVLFLGIAAMRVGRFLRALRGTVPADPELVERIENLARRIGVSLPRIRVVDAAVSPMIWSGIGGATLILPLGLMRQLDVAEGDTLLAHELAHIKRGDAWIRWIELAVTAALWWNPVVWWVRRHLRRAEEQACDRWVLELMPRAKRAYADGIVKTVEFLAGHGRTPALATGATGTRHIQERLTMILEPSRPGRLRRPIVPALVLALLALPVIPGFAERDHSAEDDATKAELHALEREALDLEHRLQELQLRRVEVERDLERARFKQDSAAMKRQVDELRDQGMLEAAAELEADLRETKRRLADESLWRDQQVDQERAMRDAELAYREALIAQEHAMTEENTAAVEAYEKALQMAQGEMRDRQRAMREAQAAYEKAREREHTREIAAKLKAMELERERLTEQGRDDEAAEIREQLRRIKTQLAEEQMHREYEAQHLAIARDEILERMEALGAAAGRADGDRRDKLSQELEELSQKLQAIETELDRSTVR